MKIIYDEDGNIVNEYDERNEQIKEELQETFDEFLAEHERMLALKKPPKLGYRFSKQLLLAFSKFPPMTAEKFVQLDYDDIYNAWLKFQEIMAYYNRKFELVDNKQLFCSYMGINTRQYSRLERHEDEDIRNLMNTINSYFIGLGYIAAESGNADSKAVGKRLTASGEAGHSVISAVEEKVIESAGAMTEQEVRRRLAQNGIALIED